MMQNFNLKLYYLSATLNCVICEKKTQVYLNLVKIFKLYPSFNLIATGLLLCYRNFNYF